MDNVELGQIIFWGNRVNQYECMFDRIIYLDDLEALLKDVNRALVNPERAKEVMPMPKKVRAGYDEY